MIGTILAGAAGVVAAPVVGGLAWRTARQHRVAKALEITTPNRIVEQRFVKVGGIDQWLQLRGEDRNNPVLLVLHGGPGLAQRRLHPAPSALGAALHRRPVGPPRDRQDPPAHRQGRQRGDALRPPRRRRRRGHRVPARAPGRRQPLIDVDLPDDPKAQVGGGLGLLEGVLDPAGDEGVDAAGRRVLGLVMGQDEHRDAGRWGRPRPTTAARCRRCAARR
jgi:hypothetical protein